MRVGFIGLGVMGRYMAENLLRAGHELTVYNRTAERAEPFRALGARIASTPGDAARGQDAVITIVTADAAVEEVCLGAQGAVAAASPGALLIDMSTIAPGTSRKVAAAAQARGVRFLDAPVTGGDVGAREGSLTIMVGGDEADFQSAMPLFQAMGRRIVHVGGTGLGETLKLAGNLISGLTLMVAAEGIRLALREGVPQEKIEEVLPHSSAASTELTKLLGRLREDAWEPGFSVANRLKDLRLAVEMAQADGIGLPIAPEALRLLTAHDAQGGAPLDESSYLRALLA